MMHLKEILDPANKLYADTQAVIKRASEKCYQAFIDRIATEIYSMKNQGGLSVWIEYGVYQAAHVNTIMSDLKELGYDVSIYEGTVRNNLIIRWSSATAKKE